MKFPIRTHEVCLALMLCVTLLIWLKVLPVSAYGQDRIKVAYDGTSGQQAPLWLASDLGLFRKYGIEENVVLIMNAPVRMASLAANETQFGVGAAIAPLTAAVAGADSIIVATYHNKHLASFAVGPEIRTPQDLKGKDIGVTSIGGAAHLAAAIALKQLGIDERSVTIRPAGGSSDRLASLLSHRITATILNEPYSQLARKAGAHILLDLGESGEGFPTVSVVTTRKFLAAKRETVKQFLKGISEGVYVFRTDRERSVKSLAKWLRTNDQEVLDLTYKTHAKKMSFPPYTDLSGVQAVLDFLSRNRPEAKNRKAHEFVDEGILKELEREGFFSALQKQ
jgi:ABC-type nitrate/sulfonate/bicarbonate transport system substrate-binding protein